ncbi:hypothetical protein ADUPG1_010215, partial [Aduncisulcus paluster]
MMEQCRERLSFTEDEAERKNPPGGMLERERKRMERLATTGLLDEKPVKKESPEDDKKGSKKEKEKRRGRRGKILGRKKERYSAVIDSLKEYELPSFQTSTSFSVILGTVKHFLLVIKLQFPSLSDHQHKILDTHVFCHIHSRIGGKEFFLSTVRMNPTFQKAFRFPCKCRKLRNAAASIHHHYFIVKADDSTNSHPQSLVIGFGSDEEMKVLRKVLLLPSSDKRRARKSIQRPTTEKPSDFTSEIMAKLQNPRSSIPSQPPLYSRYKPELFSSSRVISSDSAMTWFKFPEKSSRPRLSSHSVSQLSSASQYDKLHYIPPSSKVSMTPMSNDRGYEASIPPLDPPSLSSSAYSIPTPLSSISKGTSSAQMDSFPHLSHHFIDDPPKSYPVSSHYHHHPGVSATLPVPPYSPHSVSMTDPSSIPKVLPQYPPPSSLYPNPLPPHSSSGYSPASLPLYLSEPSHHSTASLPSLSHHHRTTSQISSSRQRQVVYQHQGGRGGGHPKSSNAVVIDIPSMYHHQRQCVPRMCPDTVAVDLIDPTDRVPMTPIAKNNPSLPLPHDGTPYSGVVQRRINPSDIQIKSTQRVNPSPPDASEPWQDKPDVQSSFSSGLPGDYRRASMFVPSHRSMVHPSLHYSSSDDSHRTTTQTRPSQKDDHIFSSSPMHGCQHDDDSFHFGEQHSHRVPSIHSPSSHPKTSVISSFPMYYSPSMGGYLTHESTASSHQNGHDRRQSQFSDHSNPSAESAQYAHTQIISTRSESQSHSSQSHDTDRIGTNHGEYCLPISSESIGYRLPAPEEPPRDGNINFNAQSLSFGAPAHPPTFPLTHSDHIPELSAPSLDSPDVENKVDTQTCSSFPLANTYEYGSSSLFSPSTKEG